MFEQQRKALIVDDNIFNLVVLEGTLKEKFNFDCERAMNGVEAIRAVEDQGSPYYKLILMDINMPIMDGISATNILKKRFGASCPPIIALTAYNTEETKSQCLEAGMADFLSKPIELEKLEAIILKLLNR